MFTLCTANLANCTQELWTDLIDRRIVLGIGRGLSTISLSPLQVQGSWEGRISQGSSAPVTVQNKLPSTTEVCHQYWIWGTKMKRLCPSLPGKAEFHVGSLHGLQTGKVVHPISQCKNHWTSQVRWKEHCQLRKTFLRVICLSRCGMLLQVLIILFQPSVSLQLQSFLSDPL